MQRTNDDEDDNDDDNKIITFSCNSKEICNGDKWGLWLLGYLNCSNTSELSRMEEFRQKKQIHNTIELHL